MVNSFLGNFPVYSVKSSVYIKKSNFAQLKKELLFWLPPESIKEDSSVCDMLRQCNWSPRINIHTGDIIKLIYHSNEWSYSCLGDRAINVLRRFIEPGGYIQMVDENRRYYWVYKFTGTTYLKYTLIKEFIDFKDNDNVLELFNKLVNRLLKSGMNRKELKLLIDKNLIENIL